MGTLCGMCRMLGTLRHVQNAGYLCWHVQDAAGNEHTHTVSGSVAVGGLGADLLTSINML